MRPKLQIRVRFDNLGWWATDVFDTIEAAAARARAKGFEASFWLGRNFMGSWSPIGGLRLEGWVR